MKISFIINGKNTEIDVPPDRRVIDIIREDLGLTGTKEGCGSGECSACTILVDNESKLACLMVAPQINGKKITTIEGLAGNGILHPLQEAFVKYGAIQCGFCTPGMVLTAMNILKKNPEPSREEIRKGISGNLCRCTGYQKIVDAIETVAGEQLPVTGEQVSESGKTRRHTSHIYRENIIKKTFMPETLEELWKILKKETSPLICAGGTDLLVKKRYTGNTLIFIENIEKLKGIKDCDEHIWIGPGTTINQIIYNPVIKKEVPLLVKAMNEMGGHNIRNMATIGGNICTASPAGDSLPPLYLFDTELELMSEHSTRKIPIEDFIKGPGKTSLKDGEILTGIVIKKPSDFNIQHFEKVGQRKSLAISIASFAALLRINNGGIIEKSRFAWGSVGPTVIRSHEIDKILNGKTLSIENLNIASEMVKKSVKPVDDIRASAEYRRNISGNLMLRLFIYK
ncbi:MAG: FAD binding domain-containing protein [Candidatus Eremiobacterota bacterium]